MKVPRKVTVPFLIWMLTTLFSALATNPPECPSPIPDGVRVNPAIEARAWNTAKALSVAPKTWEKPGFVIWKHELQTDGKYRFYGYYYQETHMHLETGRIAHCEYIEVLTFPMEGDKVVFDTLTHEYLHAIFFRFAAMSPSFAEAHKDDLESYGEAWVQSLWPH